MRDVDLYNITADPEVLRAALIELRKDFDAHNHDGINSKSFETIIVETLRSRTLSVGVNKAGVPPFEVLSDGKATVSALERNDFHWYTLLESLTGFTVTAGATLTGDYAQIATTNVANNYQYIVKAPIYSPALLTWAKDRKIRTKVYFADNTAQTIWINADGGSNTTSVNNHLGFKVLNGTLYGTVADGVTEATLDCGAVSGGGSHSLEIKFIAGVSAEFIVDGVSKGFIRQNLPTGTQYASNILIAEITTTENVIKTIRLSFWEVWQAN